MTKHFRHLTDIQWKILQEGLKQGKIHLMQIALDGFFLPGAGGRQEVEHGYKGKGSLLHLIIDKEGMTLSTKTTSAKGNERDQAVLLLDQLYLIQCKDTSRMSICKADKEYDLDKLRQEMLARGYVSVERAFAWRIRKCRRLMMRWERKPEVWEAFALLGVIFIWIQRLLG